MELEEEISINLMEMDTTLSSEAHEGDIMSTLNQRYGRNPRHLEKFGRMETKVRLKRIPKAVFEEARKRNKCVKCVSDWQPGHRCLPASILEHIMRSIQRDEIAVHMVSNLVIGLEE